MINEPTGVLTPANPGTEFGRRRDAMLCLGLAIWVAGSAALGIWLAGVADSIAPLWLANAGALAIVLRSPQKLRVTLVITFAATLMVVNVIGGLSLPIAIGLMAANVLEIVVATHILAAGGWADERQATKRSLVVLIAGAGVAGPALSSIVATLTLVVFMGADAISSGAHWFLADSLGMLLLSPFLLSISPRDTHLLMHRGALIELFKIIAINGVTVGLVFLQSPFPLLFLVISALVLAAFRLRFAGAATAVLVVAAIAAPLTILGYGPIANNLPDVADRILFLQGFLAVAVLTTLPIAATLAERAILQARLASTDRMFRGLTEGAPVGIFRTDRAGQLTFVNPSWTALLGQVGETPATSHWLDHFLVEDRTALDAARAASAVTGDAFEQDARLANGRWVTVRMTPDMADGAPQAWVAAAYDIDERRQEEIAISESERRYRLLADNSNDMIVRIGLDGVRRYISPACRRMLGYEPEELIGDTPIADIHAEDRARVADVIRSLLTGVTDPTASYRQRHKDGHYVWLEAVYRLVCDADTGEPVEFIATVRDISRRQAAELAATEAAAALKESNRLLGMAENLTRVGHWRYDVIARSVFWSPQLYEISGQPADYVPTLDTTASRYHPEDREMVSAQVAQALKTGESFRFEARVMRPDGGFRWVAATGQGEVAPNGTVVGLFGVFQDITDRIAAEHDLIAARDAAQAATAAKSDFLATMSHEIRTPMAGVIGMIDLLRSDPPAADRERFFDALEQSANLLMTVLDDILDFSKIESRNLILERIDFDLIALCRNTLDLFHNAASRKGLLLTLNGPAAPVWVKGDPTRVQQVLSNLISNAVKFTQTGTIELRLNVGHAMRRRRVRFEVIDTGIGIAADAVERLFKPFVQADASTTRKFGGTGLGLAITHRLVDAMNGTVGVESEPDRGSTFWLELDFEKGGKSGGARRGVVTEPAAGRRLSVLVAEDNQVNRVLIAAQLGREGHDVTCVENGRLAVQAAARDAYDLILMDMQMPEMDGLAATRAIRGGDGPCATAPIVALTADASPERRRFYDNCGLTEFLTKPLDTVLLRSLLTDVAMQPAGTLVLAQGGNDVPVLDEAKVTALEDALGAANAHQLLSMLAEHVRDCPGRIATLLGQGNVTAVRIEAHSLRGAASGVGASRVAAAAAALEDGESDQLAARVAELNAAARATLLALDMRDKQRASRAS